MGGRGVKPVRGVRMAGRTASEPGTTARARRVGAGNHRAGAADHCCARQDNSAGQADRETVGAGPPARERQAGKGPTQRRQQTRDTSGYCSLGSKSVRTIMQ